MKGIFNGSNKKIRISIILICILIFIILPFTNFLNDYWIRVLTNIFMWICLAQSWNVIGGYCGRLNFGAVVFFGVGAYTTAGFMKAGFPFFATLPLCCIIAVFLAVVIGVPTLRLKGAYFAIATWALAEVVKELATLIPYLGGTQGMIMPPVNQPKLFYYLMFGVMLIANLHVYFIDKMKLGYEMKSIREDEMVAEIIGVDTFKVKLEAFMISAVYSSICGGIFSQWITYISPTDVFAGTRTDEMIIMAILGGIGTVAGPIIGAIFFISIKEFIWSILSSSSLYTAILGAIFILVVLFMPNGIYGIIKNRKFTTTKIDILKNLKGFFKRFLKI